MQVKNKLHDFVKNIYFSNHLSLLELAVKFTLIPGVPFYVACSHLDRIFKSMRCKKLTTPVVSVGNLSVGGSGKTPFVLRLLGELFERGYKPAVLKRGQGSAEGIISPGPADFSTVEYGDEVALIKKRYPELILGVGKDRYEIGAQIQSEYEVDVFVLDDGFQHYKLARDLDVVLLGSCDEIDEYRLPAGPLRESPGALRRSDFISVKEGSVSDQILIKLSKKMKCKLLTHCYNFEKIVRNEQDITDEFRQKKACLLTTLARPRELVDFLEKEDFEIAKIINLPDHAPISRKDIPPGINFSDLLVTEKEYVKLPDKIAARVGCIHSRLEIQPLSKLLTVVLNLIQSRDEDND